MEKVDLTNPIYHDDAKAREHLERLLWPDGPVCPRCGVMGDRITKLKGKSTRPGVYKCKDCRKPFSVTVGTVMERSKIGNETRTCFPSKGRESTRPTDKRERRISTSAHYILSLGRR